MSLHMKLYGMPLSNYFNMVKHAMLEKGLDFEVVEVRPSQEPEFLAKSPMGKVPVLETEHGFISETDAILDYLDDAFPRQALFPQDPFARAKVRQLIKTQELYVETPAHNLIGALFGREVPESVKAHSRPAAHKGLAALGRLVHFRPWICGETFTAADIFVFHSFTLSNRLTRLVYDWDMLEEVPGLAEWYLRVANREVTRELLREQHAAQAALASRNRS
jgi:glutathione S-transferase